MSAITTDPELPISVRRRIPARPLRFVAAVAGVALLAIGVTAVVTDVVAPSSASAATYAHRACASWQSNGKSTATGRADAFKAASMDTKWQPFAWYYYQLPAFANPSWPVDGLALSAVNNYCATQ